jgi:putative membrane protein
MSEKTIELMKENPDEDQTAMISPKDYAREFLANERTFLAWIRTSIAVISLGFVISKFGIWLEDLSASISPQLEQFRVGASVPIGIGMIIFGGLLSLLAALRYHKVNLQIEQGVVKADRGLIIMITLIVMVLSLVMVIYMLIATNQF